MTSIWECRFSGGMVDGATIDVDVVPPPLVFVSPCPEGCADPHRKMWAHLVFDPEIAPLSAVVYRRTSLDARLKVAVYELGRSTSCALVAERELVEA